MIAIYEPIYLPDQKLAEPAFRPLRTEGNEHADWREFYLLVDMYRRGLHRQQSFTGLMSPKFRLKTGVSGTQFIEFVNANSDADVCFINPFPHIAYLSFNVWMQGECAHPGLTPRAQALLDAAGIKLTIADMPRHDLSLLCYCNFWVGSERFWDTYVGGVLLPIAEFLEKHPDDPISRDVLSPTLHSQPAPFLPFIVERLFSSFLSRPAHVLAARAYPLDLFKSCFNKFEKDMVVSVKDTIDAADRVGLFPDTLKNNMASRCRLWERYNRAYYWHQPHPYSGGVNRII
jgi:hypothetical protein